MNVSELSARVDALSNELGRMDTRFEAIAKRIVVIQEEIDRNQKNAATDSYELRQRIRALETGR